MRIQDLIPLVSVRTLTVCSLPFSGYDAHRAVDRIDQAFFFGHANQHGISRDGYCKKKKKKSQQLSSVLKDSGKHAARAEVAGVAMGRLAIGGCS